MATNTVQYFPLSQLHQEIDDTLMGAVRFNTDQELTDTQKAQARENIGAVSFGSNLKILGHVDTVAELQESAPQNVGDAYSVGTATPYNLYIFDGLRNEWLDYGQIRAADISAQYVENQVIAASAWAQDDTSLAGYSYKAQITVSGASGNDFPIVAFNQSDAVSGNFAPLSFSFDGYLEIWAKEKPTAAVTIPIATVIVNGGNGRGITNATGGIAAGSIKTADLADGSVVASKIGNGVVGRAKLAMDALISPYVYVNSSPYVLSADDIEKTFVAVYALKTALTFRLTNTVSSQMKQGAVMLFTQRFAGRDVIVETDGITCCIEGDSTERHNAKFRVSQTFGTMAMRKISHDSTGAKNDYWIVTGSVEVVT